MISLFSLIGVLGACACVGSSPILSHDVNDVAIVENNKLQPKLVNYDDTNYQITFTADELNNYSFDNLYDSLLSVSVEDFTSTTILYNSLTFSYNAYGGLFVYKNGYSPNVKNIYLPNEYQNSGVIDKTYFRYNSLFNKGGFEFDLIWVLNSSVYSSIKSALDLDIQANTRDINSGIFQTLTDSIVAFVGSLGSGITAMTAVFYDSVNQQLTAIGLLSVIVVSVSLTYFLFRLIIGLIRMRG